MRCRVASVYLVIMLLCCIVIPTNTIIAENVIAVNAAEDHLLSGNAF